MGFKIIGLLIYVCLSATGLTLIKTGLNKDSTVVISVTGVSLSFNWILIIGMCLYVLSFLASLLVMKNMNLSFFYPLSAGMIYVLVCVFGIVILGDSISKIQIIGMLVILTGIVLMNLGTK